MKNVKRCKLIKNVLRKNKNICLRYIMHRHKLKTRQRRQKQLERARGEDTPERGSVAAAAAKQRAFLIGNDGTKTPVRRLGGLQRYNIVPADELSRLDFQTSPPPLQPKRTSLKEQREIWEEEDRRARIEAERRGAIEQIRREPVDKDKAITEDWEEESAVQNVLDAEANRIQHLADATSQAAEMQAKRDTIARPRGVLSKIICHTHDKFRKNSASAQLRETTRNLARLGEHVNLHDYHRMIKKDEKKNLRLRQQREKTRTVAIKGAKIGAIILAATLLILMITYIPGADESAAIKKASWTGWLTGSSTFTALEELALRFPEGLINALTYINKISPGLYQSFSEVMAGTGNALNQATLTTIVGKFIKEGGKTFVLNRLYDMAMKRDSELSSDSTEEKELIDKVNNSMPIKTALQENLQRFGSAEGNEAMEMIDKMHFEGGGSRPYKKYRKTKKRFSKKTKKKRLNKHALSKKRRGANKSSKRRHRKSRRTRK